MMRPSVQYRLCRGFSAFAVLAGFVGSVVACSTFGASAWGVPALGVSVLVSTAVGRSIYFGASAFGASTACGTSAVFGASAILAGAGAGVASTSLPANDKLRSPACAVAEARTNPAITMNLRI